MGNLTIKVSGREKDILEGCLNAAHQGDLRFAVTTLAFMALAKGWEFGKLAYYLKEMGAEI